MFGKAARFIKVSSERNSLKRLLNTMTTTKTVGYLTDLEGNYEYWKQYLRLSNIFSVEGADLKLRNDCEFVFGGDVVDRGSGDIRLLQDLLKLKTQYPKRVHFIMGNRDINKLRIPYSLHPGILATHPNVWWVPRGRDNHELVKLNDKISKMKWVSKVMPTISFIE